MIENLTTFHFVLIGLSTTLTTFIIAYGIRKSIQYHILKSAKDEAEEILDDVKSEIELRDLEQKAKAEEISLELWTKVEAEHLKLEERAEELQELIDERKKKNELAIEQIKTELNQKNQFLVEDEKRLTNFEKNVTTRKTDLLSLMSRYSDRLSQHLNVNKATVIEEQKQAFIFEAESRAQKLIQTTEEETKNEAEFKAKRLLGINIDRFSRPYCAERGISGVYFENEFQRKNLCDPEGKNIRAIQTHCGCDIFIQDGNDLIGVAGYDPVRRELTRRVLEKLINEKKSLNPDLIQRIAENEKRNLFRQIKNDGDQLAKELKLENMNPEIKQVMGSLRFRYSFTQNQYFHCAEVGWLAGLLAAEIGADTKVARRAGTLHDLGKAMDHQMDGGHAVIGADFINKRGEKPDVVHAVKAHHFDEQPSTDEAFLVIAADAISGARPGARRSTVETYTQKVNDIQEIAKSFDGVTDCFVLSGGREARVHVNSKRIDDLTALKYAKDIAKKIEDECSYPGQIKVVVVRETFTQEQTMAYGKS